ncbi:MAG: hypothetical protein RL653_455 [Pseudomonadota bacterium]
MKLNGRMGAWALVVSLALAGCGTKPATGSDAGTQADGGAGGGTGGGTGGGAGGGSGGGSGGGTGGGVTLATYCGQQAEALCAAYVRCQFVSASAESDCRASAAEGCAGLAADVGLGRRTFDAAAAAACLAALPTDGCDAIGSECSDTAIFKGAVPAAGACLDSSDCAAGSCRDVTETTCGTCVPFGALGADCRSDGGVTCGAGLWCEPSTDGGRACADKREDGEPCTTRRACASGWCNYDSYLVEFPDAGRTCGTHPAGAPCADVSDCEDGLWCAGYTYDPNSYDTLTNGTCTARPDAGTVSQGGTCAEEKDCVSGYFCEGQEGTSAGLCTPRGGAGAPCSLFAYYFTGVARECLDGFGCGENGCVKLGDVGEQCEDGSQCKFLLSCPMPLADAGIPATGSPLYGRCFGPVALGGNCMGENVLCAAGSFCDSRAVPGPSWTCTALLAVDAPCEDDGQCASGTCGSGGTCAAPLTCQ